ncbi:MAG TPA: hypothetical protein VGX94_01480 [Terriglobia bacterium]|nr:hypothetical protein [Terriglobia bacterium]
MSEIRSSLRKKLIFIVVLGFCSLSLIDWTGITGRGFPSNWSEALIQVCINIGWTLFFTVVFWFVMIRPFWQSSSAKGANSQTQRSDRRTKAG